METTPAGVAACNGAATLGLIVVNPSSSPPERLHFFLPNNKMRDDFSPGAAE
jgi:hypothetical protein